jgi:hypothetical protein
MLAHWFVDGDAKKTAASANSDEELPWPSGGFRGTSEGEKERSLRGSEGCIWGGRSRSGRRGKRGRIDDDGFQLGVTAEGGRWS